MRISQIIRVPIFTRLGTLKSLRNRYEEGNLLLTTKTHGLSFRLHDNPLPHHHNLHHHYRHPDNHHQIIFFIKGRSACLPLQNDERRLGNYLDDKYPDNNYLVDDYPDDNYFDGNDDNDDNVDYNGENGDEINSYT